MDYNKIEEDFDCACQDVIKRLSTQYVSTYQSGGPGMLEAFFELIRSEFQKAEEYFIGSNNLSDNQEALKRVRAIAKNQAKKCLEHYSKVK